MNTRIKPKILLPSSNNVTIRTFMIGTIDLFEQYFGEVWGHDKEENDITDEEEEFYEKFLELRERILDLGNQAIGVSYNKKGKMRRQIYGRNN